MRQCLEVLRGGTGFRIVFQRRQDRYAHWIEAVQNDEKEIVLASLEGDELDAWPTSPPLQQLSFERRPDGSTVALAIGMAGTSHWSLSVEVDPHSLATEFDVACRCVQRPEALGSRYKVTGSCHFDSPCVSIRSASGGLTLLPIAHGAAEPLGKLDWDADQQELHIAPAESQLLASDRVWTVRWRYRVEWNDK